MCRYTYICKILYVYLYIYIYPHMVAKVWQPAALQSKGTCKVDAKFRVYCPRKYPKMFGHVSRYPLVIQHS